MNNESIPQQIDALEACLRAVLAWHEQPMSSNSLRARINGSLGFWTEDDLLEAADSLGYEVEINEHDSALSSLPELPAICLTHEVGALALLSVNDEGLLLVVDPNRSDKPEWTSKQDLFGRLTGRCLCLSKRDLGKLGAGNATDTLVALLIGVAIIFVSDFAIRTLRGYFLDLASAKADAAIADSLFEHMLDAKLQSRRGSSGAVASMMKEFESIRDFLTSATLTTFIDIPFAILFLFVIWLIGGPLFWVPFLAIPVMLLSGLAVQPQLSRLVKESQEDGHHKHAILVETLNGLETIKSLGAGSMMRRRWQDAVSHQSHIGLKSRMLAQLATNVANMAQQFVQVGVIAIGALLVRDGQLGFGAIIACTILAGRAIAPMAQITQLLTRINQTSTSYKALNLLMSHEREHAHGQVFLSRPEFKGAIEFRNVTFSYPGASRPTLDDVSFQIAPGDKVAIIGKVGSGKTTVSKLILGLYKPDSGSVLIDGVDVRQIDPADLRRALGVVLQDVWLIGGTIKQNIALGGDYPNDAEILHAAQIAGVDDFVKQHPEGYGLRLGERGEGLSGGQRQAVAIARALLRKPQILLFDEATSAMDQGAETALLQKIGSEIGQRTFVTITHKASLLQMVNKIIVIEQGKVAAQGTPEQLLRRQQAVAQPTAPAAAAPASPS